MRIPDDPLQQRAQDAFAVMEVVAALGALMQVFVIGSRGGWADPDLRVRLLINAAISGLMIAALLLFTRSGRILASARFSAVGIMAFNLGFAHAYGLRGTPTPHLLTLALLSVVALVERPRMMAVWVALNGGVLVFGLFNEPRWVMESTPLSVATGMLFILGFCTLFAVEVRSTVTDALRAVRVQADGLARTNAELRQAIEERDRLSNELAATQRMDAMGRMAGSIAHDFNNLLTVIAGYTGLIADDTPADSARRTDVEHLMGAVSRASRVTREVLDFASPRPIVRQPTDLAAFLHELAPSLRTLVSPRNSLVLDTDRVGAAGVADVDRAQLERLIMNLVTNARDVTPPGGEIHLVLRVDDERVRCSVIDGGPGVAPELRERIFEPFFTTKGTAGGTGLGLASAFAIARQHGGAIHVDDAPTGGAVFSVDLPRAAQQPVVAPDPRPEASPRPLNGLHVVLVEDDLPVQRLTTRLLTRAGGQVRAFDNSADAVGYLRDASTSAVDLVVTDLRLPGGSGLEVIEAARARVPHAAMVAVSGFLDDAEVAELAARQVLQFLTKPFSEQQLLEAIARARGAAVT